MLNTYIGRVIAFLGAALSAAVATVIANEAQTLLHMHLSQAHLVAFLAPFVLGAFAVAHKWLTNLGAQELASLEKTFGVTPAVAKVIEEEIVKRLPPVPKDEGSQEAKIAVSMPKT